jgi:XTP/dITP diphosphohydrolase
MKELLFVSGNAHKVSEVNAYLAGVVRVIGLQDVGLQATIEETEDSLAGNARLKAQYAWDRLGIPCFSDDTGLEVNALGGAPGVQSARYASPHQDDAANRAKLLHEMQGQLDRSAAFHTVVCLIQEGRHHYFHGRVAGTIRREAQGTQGFGYDPLFVAAGTSRTFAEMSLDEKNLLSHRARALHELRQFLVGR